MKVFSATPTPACIWLTGLPCAGKSTIARALSKRLNSKAILNTVLDADEIRHTLNADLGFCRGDRTENARRIAEVAKMFLTVGAIPIVAAISPYRDDRNLAASIIRPFSMIEIYVHAPVDVCIARDVKGLYARARMGEVTDLVGVDVCYEPPERPHVTIDSALLGVEQAVEHLWLAISADVVPVGMMLAHGTAQRQQR